MLLQWPAADPPPPPPPSPSPSPPSPPAAVATNKESREEKRSLWRHARELGGMQQMQTESAKVVSIFSSFAILFLCYSEVYYNIFSFFFSKMGLHKNYKVSVFPLQFNLIFSSGGFLFFIFINLNK